LEDIFSYVICLSYRGLEWQRIYASFWFRNYFQNASGNFTCDFIYAFFVVPWVASLWHKRKRILKFILPVFFLVLIKHFSLFLTSSGRYTTDFTPGDSYFIELLFFLIIFLSMIIFVCNIRNIRELLVLNFALVLGCAIAPTVDLIFFPHLIGTRVTSEAGVSVPGGFWNFAVIGVVTTFWFSFCLMGYYSKKQRVLLWVLLGVIILGSFVGLSRTVLISLGLSSLTYLFLSKNLPKKIYFLLFILVGFVVFDHYFGFVLSNLQSRISEYEGGFYDSSRVDIWKEYLSHISEYWLFGSSPEGHRFFCQDRSGPHSIFLNWFVRFGVAGLLAFLWLLLGVFESVIKIGKYLSREKYARIMAWVISYITLVAYNKSGFLTPSLYTMFAFIFVLAAIGQESAQAEILK